MNINKISNTSFGANATCGIVFNKNNTYSYQEIEGKNVVVNCNRKLKNTEQKDEVIADFMDSILPENIEKVEVLATNKKGDLSIFKVDRDENNAQRFHFEEKSVDGAMIAKSQVYIKEDLYETSNLAFQNAIDTYLKLINPKDVKEVMISFVV